MIKADVGEELAHIADRQALPTLHRGQQVIAGIVDVNRLLRV